MICNIRCKKEFRSAAKEATYTWQKHRLSRGNVIDKIHVFMSLYSLHLSLSSEVPADRVCNMVSYIMAQDDKSKSNIVFMAI